MTPGATTNECRPAGRRGHDLRLEVDGDPIRQLHGHADRIHDDGVVGDVGRVVRGDRHQRNGDSDVTTHCAPCASAPAGRLAIVRLISSRDVNDVLAHESTSSRKLGILVRLTPELRCARGDVGQRRWRSTMIHLRSALGRLQLASFARAHRPAAASPRSPSARRASPRSGPSPKGPPRQRALPSRHRGPPTPEAITRYRSEAALRSHRPERSAREVRGSSFTPCSRCP